MLYIICRISTSAWDFTQFLIKLRSKMDIIFASRTGHKIQWYPRQQRPGRCSTQISAFSPSFFHLPSSFFHALSFLFSPYFFLLFTSKIEPAWESVSAPSVFFRSAASTPTWTWVELSSHPKNETFHGTRSPPHQTSRRRLEVRFP